MSTAETTIRLAAPIDAAGIAALYSQLLPNTGVRVLPERIADLARDPNTGLFVSETEGKVCGTALVSLCADVMFGFQPFAVLENVVVDVALRSQGVGSKLLVHIEDFCLARDCSRIMLLSSENRGDAHRFFQRQGFTSSTKVGFVKYRRNFATCGERSR